MPVRRPRHPRAAARWLLLWAINGNDDGDNATAVIEDPDLLLGSHKEQVGAVDTAGGEGALRVAEGRASYMSRKKGEAHAAGGGEKRMQREGGRNAFSWREGAQSSV
jgi:hypothetical protein